MKIKNISIKSISIPFKDVDGKSHVVNLQPGQIIYCENGFEKSNPMVIYQRKQVIEVSPSDKPQSAEYYHAYGVLPHSEVLKLKQQHIIISPITIEDIEEESEEDDVDEDIEISNTGIEIDVNEDDVDIIETEEGVIPQKNKGGRPKGVKNKSKKGRPKKKKPLGRPSKKGKTTNLNNNTTQ